jgi:hypothetical protein
LAEFGIGDADYGNGFEVRMLRQNLFQFDWVNIFATLCETPAGLEVKACCLTGASTNYRSIG